jgi:hypothetical protein
MYTDNNLRAASGNRNNLYAMNDYYNETPPQGICKVELCGKVWGKHMNLFLYFRCLETETLFRLSAFRRGEGYCDRGGNIDFSKIGTIHNIYTLEITTDKKSRAVLNTAFLE